MMNSLVTGQCRDSLVAADVDFILAATRADRSKAEALQALLCDAHTRDLLLDDPALMAALMDRPGYVHISMQLFFYLVVRRVLRVHRSQVLHSCLVVTHCCSIFSKSSVP